MSILCFPRAMPAARTRSANMFGKPLVLDGLGCRNISIAGYTLAKGNEVFVAGEDLEMPQLLSLLRARKVFRQTRILLPTDGKPSFSPDTGVGLRRPRAATGGLGGTDPF